MLKSGIAQICVLIMVLIALWFTLWNILIALHQV
jgi:hypothetical protein